MKANVYAQHNPNQHTDRDGRTIIWEANLHLVGTVVGNTMKDIWAKAKKIRPAPVLEMIGE